eukprot:TRINITY_DN6240_c0_g1_i1.p1 TRINITY_DN6240_c0_g1~~TRINITY_DN6240_c0_g1_i1.p1  ORF type:complete len:122 (+),score=17.58 TRINITY_DN6240_c0_g1_i1:82-447(+)
MGCGNSSRLSVLDQAPPSAKPCRAISNVEILRTLGVGATAKVCLVKDKNDGKVYALKIMDKKADNEKSKHIQQTLYDNEVKILQLLPCEYLLELIDNWEDTRSFYIMTGFCCGGELFDRVR